MPIHVYCCPCGKKFDRFRAYGSLVATATCDDCGREALKSYHRNDLFAAAIPDIEEYYEEQLDKVITGRRGLKNAMREVNVDSDGLVKPEWM